MIQESAAVDVRLRADAAAAFTRVNEVLERYASIPIASADDSLVECLQGFGGHDGTLLVRIVTWDYHEIAIRIDMAEMTRDLPTYLDSLEGEIRKQLDQHRRSQTRRPIHTIAHMRQPHG